MEEPEIVDVKPILDLSPRGVFVKKYRVYFKMPNGEIDWVEIDASEYSEAKAREIVNKIYKEHKKLLGK